MCCANNLICRLSHMAAYCLRNDALTNFFCHFNSSTLSTILFICLVYSRNSLGNADELNYGNDAWHEYACHS